MLDETYYCQLKTMSYLHFKEKTKQIKQNPQHIYYFLLSHLKAPQAAFTSPSKIMLLSKSQRTYDIINIIIFNLRKKYYIC